jgi:hypothetical protein
MGKNTVTSILFGVTPQVALFLFHRKALSGEALMPALCDGTLNIAVLVYRFCNL